MVSRGQEELALVARRITELTGVTVNTMPLDLSQAGAPQALFEHLQKDGIQVDILVNNAGVGMSGAFAEAGYVRMSQMLQLNMLALSQLTQLFLQPMLERRQGRILNIGSLVAYFTGAPNWSAYVASKHYVRAFTKGLSRELKGSGVAATLIAPGATPTDFVRTANTGDMLAYQASRGPTVEQIAKLA